VVLVHTTTSVVATGGIALAAILDAIAPKSAGIIPASVHMAFAG
jgi:hypothetical protein